jgi:hypothetical protein
MSSAKRREQRGHPKTTVATSTHAVVAVFGRPVTLCAYG